MPVGKANSSTKSKTKEEVSHRIQEIKQRQQNWFKQRDKSKQQNELIENSRTSEVATVSIKDNVQNSMNGARKIVNDLDKNNVREKFKHWIDTRNPLRSCEENTPDFNDSNSVLSGAESELERLVSPDDYSTTQPVSEEEFGNLAEKIAHKVKEDLGLQQLNLVLSGTPTRINVTDDGKSVRNSNRCKTFIQEVPKFNHVVTPTLSSHNCIVCKRLMLSAKNTPTMVIPCGHTICKSCLEGAQTCPSCDSLILSLTVNIMLLQVIKEYHSNQDPSRSKSEFFGTSGENYGKLKTSYKTQLENLETRQSILLTEHKTLVHKQKQLVNRISLEQNQTQNIKRQEEEIEKAISELQEKLKVLKEHRESYNWQIMELQDEKFKMEEKITLLSTTIDSLTKETEKVKLLSENELTANTD